MSDAFLALSRGQSYREGEDDGIILAKRVRDIISSAEHFPTSKIVYSTRL